MNPVQALVLGAVQGATEFLPISSSGHLVLVPWALGWDKPGLVFDTTVHLGTLVAVLAYFYRDLWSIFIAWLRSFRPPDSGNDQARLAWLILIGTLPAVVLGYLLQDFFESLFGRPLWVALLLIVTAFLLAVAERMGKRQRPLRSLKWRDALTIGLAQACAIAPGISRSGATISGGLLRGMKREDAARFSFLLSTPIIFGTGLLQLKDVVSASAPPGQWAILALGFGASAITGYLFIHWLMKHLQEHSLYPFAIYCACVGIIGASIAIGGVI